MIASGDALWLVVLQVGLLGAVLAYDLRRARRGDIVGERLWRRRRAVADAVALAAVLAFHFWRDPGSRPVAVEVAMTVFGVACVAILACSIPLKRLLLQARADRSL
jgi:anti-sigma-K factor RskA